MRAEHYGRASSCPAAAEVMCFRAALSNSAEQVRPGASVLPEQWESACGAQALPHTGCAAAPSGPRAKQAWKMTAGQADGIPQLVAGKPQPPLREPAISKAKVLNASMCTSTSLNDCDFCYLQLEGL